MVNVAVGLKIYESNRAIVLVGSQENQTAVTGPLVRLLRSSALRCPGPHLSGRVVGSGDLADRTEKHIRQVRGIALFIGAYGDFHTPGY
jgi:hypothetical protein